MKLSKHYNLSRRIESVDEVIKLAGCGKLVWINGYKKIRADVLQDYPARVLASMIKSTGLFEIAHVYKEDTNSMIIQK